MLPIANYEKKYLLSKFGEVINLANNIPLKPIVNSNGYLKVSLANGDGTSFQCSIHKLVALHYLPNPYGYSQINHKDGNKLNNDVDNLEWCSSKENIQHAFKIGLRPGYMSMDEKLILISRVLSGELIRDLAIEIGRSETSLSGMLRKAADKSNQRDAWNSEMKRRRADVAIRNLAKINN